MPTGVERLFVELGYTAVAAVSVSISGEDTYFVVQARSKFFKAKYSSAFLIFTS